MASQSNLSLASTSPSARDCIPLEIIEEIIVNYALHSDSDRQQRYEDFKTLSLVNSHFKATARNHTHFFRTQRFYTKQRLRDYIKFVKENPKSDVPQRITTLKMRVDWGKYDSDMLEWAISVFFAWKLYFPNVRRIELCPDNEAYYMRGWDDQRAARLLNAMHGVLASHNLHHLSLICAKLPAGFFNETGPALKTLKISNVQALEGKLSIPRGLECLELDTSDDLIHAYEACRMDPELFGSIKELSINECQYYGHYQWGASWGLIYNLKDSLKRLEVTPGAKFVDSILYPLDILELTKLESLTILTSHLANPTTYIPWISTVYKHMDRILARHPHFTFQVVIYPTYTDDVLEHVIEFDDWLMGFFPQDMKVEVIVRLSYAYDVEDYWMYYRNCTHHDKRILKFEYEDCYINY